MITLDAYPIPVSNVVGRIMDDEAVLVLPDKGQVKVLNEVGARIWSLIDGKRSVGELASMICEEYEVDGDLAEADTIEFVADLIDRGIATLSERPQNN